MNDCMGCALHPVTTEWVKQYPSLAAAEINDLRNRLAAANFAHAILTEAAVCLAEKNIKRRKP